MKFIAETEKDNEALKILSAFVQDESKLVPREEAFAVTMLAESHLDLILRRHNSHTNVSRERRLAALKEAEPRLATLLSRATYRFLKDLAVSLEEEQPWSGDYPNISRFANCHICEPGDRLESFDDNCELLITAAKVKELVGQNTCRLLTHEEFKSMVGKPVFIMTKRGVPGHMQASGWHIVPTPMYENILGTYEEEFFMGEKLFTTDYEKTWLAYTQPPEEDAL